MIYKNLEAAMLGEMSNLKNSGCSVETRGTFSREALFRNIEILDPTDIYIGNKTRKFNPKYAITEWLWYLSGNAKIDNICKFAGIWGQIKDEDNKVESNYGTYMLGEQWQYCKGELTIDKDSRRCTIVIHQPYHKHKNLADMPCTQYMQFFIRNNKLHMGVSMRSNDVVFGFSNDVFTFTLFQQLMLNELRQANPLLELGSYFHHAGSMHIYDRHYKMLDIDFDADVPEHDKRYLLKPDVTLKTIKEKELYLPIADMSKEDLSTVVNLIERELFI